ncbi:hypothetical protein R1sor_015536 [Riccia sorocarpa]|uniref:Glycosyltransferase n=1 Tax=Riccia sorocarpa TaxID=122646 RepID=A0ABD3HF75_9MARC
MGSIPEERSEEGVTPNVWVVPLAFLSHVRCFLQFAKLLASHNLPVTFFCAKWDEKSLGLQATIESWRGEGLDIRLRYIEVEEPDFSAGADNSEDWKLLFQRQEEWIDSILKHESVLAQSRPTCVISDLTTPGVHESAVKYSVPAWVFSSFSLCYTGSVAYISQLRAKGILKLPHSPRDPICQEEFISLPGLPLLRLSELDEVGVFSSHIMSPLGNRNGPIVYKSEVLILSTFEELESRAFVEYSKYLVHNSAGKHKEEKRKIYTVGPTFPLTTTPTAKPPSNEERYPCLKFLDGQAHSSVLFVAFGSTWQLAPEQMQEIAFGLEGSEQPFLCVLQSAAKTAQYPTGDVFDIIPPDCISRTKGHGLFVQGWVPQLQILGHPAVGGFLSHCGQNSVLESLSMGVPLLTWPLLVDQMMNARFVVGEIQAGLEITRDPHDESLVDRKEVETKVRALFQSEEGKQARNNALRIRELALQTVSQNGSSYKNIQALVTRIRGTVLI